MLSAKIEIGAEIRNAQGELIGRVPFRRCHSLLKQFIQVLSLQMSQANTSIKKTNGTTTTFGPNAINLAVNATIETTYGIVIGTGTTPVTMTDWKLVTQLTTDIAHQTVTFATENPNTSTWRLAITRGFANNGGSAVNVKEVGLYGCLANTTYVICLDRTLYNVTFQTGETLTLTYRITVSL